MTDKIRSEWGLKPPEDYVGPHWGARAIYHLRQVESRIKKKVKGKYKLIIESKTVADIDLLWDRQEAVGGTPEERKALTEWIDTKALLQLKQNCADVYLTDDAEETLAVESDNYKLVASPRGSHGYLYLRAYRVS